MSGLYMGGKGQELTPENVCDTCPYATRVTDNKVFCMFVQGSCARIIGSLEKPIDTVLNSSVAVSLAMKEQEQKRIRDNRAVWGERKDVVE